MHTEIDQFYAHMVPTRTEHALRVKVVTRIESVVLQMWPDAHVSHYISIITMIILIQWIIKKREKKKNV